MGRRAHLARPSCKSWVRLSFGGLSRSRSETFEEKHPLYARALSFVVFAAIILIAMALIYAFSGGSVLMSRPAWPPLAVLAGPQRMGIKESRQQLVDATLSGITQDFPFPPEQAAKADPRLVQAGFRRPEAASAFALRGLLSSSLSGGIGLFHVAFTRAIPLSSFLSRSLVGFMLPDIWLGRKSKRSPASLALGFAGRSRPPGHLHGSGLGD